MKSERESAESLFTDEKYKGFQKKYEEARTKCPDVRFEQFYRSLRNADENSDDEKATRNAH